MLYKAEGLCIIRSVCISLHLSYVNKSLQMSLKMISSKSFSMDFLKNVTQTGVRLILWVALHFSVSLLLHRQQQEDRAPVKIPSFPLLRFIFLINISQFCIVSALLIRLKHTFFQFLWVPFQLFSSVIWTSDNIIYWDLVTKGNHQRGHRPTFNGEAESYHSGHPIQAHHPAQ